MTYDPQQQRPEQQVANSNRQALNIQQPGELSDFDRQFFSSESWNKPVVEPKSTWSDDLKALVAAPLNMVADAGQLFKAGTQILDDKAAEGAGSNPLGIDSGMLDVMRQNAGNPLSRAGNAAIQGAGDLAGSAAKSILDSRTEGAKQAAALDFATLDQDSNGNITGISAGEGTFNASSWMQNAIPSIATMMTSGLLSKMSAQAARGAVEQTVFNRLSKTMPEEAARQLAKETAERAAAVAGKTTFVGAMSATAQGQGGIDMREQINSLPFNELMESSTFKTAFNSIDADPNNANLSDGQKLDLARAQVADQAASAVTADPRLLAVNIAASTLGDHTLLKLLTRKGAASGVLSGMTIGAVSEGATEFAQGAGQRYVQNEQLIDTAGQKIDPMKDVLETGVNNTVVGAGMGGAIGAVGGVRGRQVDQQSNPEPTPGDLTGEQPQSTQVDVPEWNVTEKQSSEGNGSSIPVVKMGDDSPPPGYTGEWRDGGPVISVTQGADNSQFNPENVAGTPQGRIDEFRDTPTYLRQDPRIQGFAEDSDVQRALAEQPDSPTAEQLIRQQIEQGDQGYSPQELEALEQAERIIAARRPRLPAPGQTSVIAMPGEVRQPFGDDIQAGAGPQFDAGKQVRGQEFIPAERALATNEVGRTNQTYDGEAVPTSAIEDKNIIFSGSPTIDEGQTAQPPQFTEGETRTQRQTREFSDAMGVNDQAALPDQRHRVGGMPVDAQTEAYARGEPVGQLKFYYKGRPFPSEYLAERSKWAKMEGAVVEEVDGGYAVRLPPTQEDISAAQTFPGYRIAETAVPDGAGGVVKGFSVLRTDGNRSGQRVSNHFTHEDAVQSAVRHSENDASESRQAEKRRKEAEAKRAPTDEFLDAQNLTPMQRGKADKALQEMVHYTEFDRPVTRADAVQSLVGRGWRPETAQRSSENGKAKTSYRIVSDDGDLYNVTKTEHDFAAHLVARQDSQPSEPAADTITLPSGELLTVTIDRGVSGAAYLTTEDGKRINSSTKQIESIKRELAGDHSANGGIGDLARLNAALKHIRQTGQQDATAALPKKKDTGPFYSRQMNRQEQQGSLVTQTPAFKSWFGDSKVMDATGRPLVVYHGTGSDFERFEQNTNRGAGGESARQGFFFTTSSDVANSYAEETPEFQRTRDYDRSQRLMDAGKYEEAEALERTLESEDYNGGMSPNVVPVYLSIKNPMVVDFEGRTYDASRDNLSKIIDKAKRSGHDGVLFKNIDDAPNSGLSPSDHYVAFRPEQIKSAVGNRGTFDSSDPRILYSKGTDIGGGNVIHDGSFSKDGERPAQGMLRDRVQLAADGFVSHLNGAAKIKVKAVQTQAEAAAMMPNGIPAEFGTVHAIYQPELSRVIVIADNIANARELRAKLRHEVIAHHGLASVIGDVEYDRIMRVLHQTRDSQNKTIQDVWRQVEQSYGQESLETQANEFLAHMAERTELTKLGGAWDRFVTLLTNALRKAGVLNPMDITPAEIRNILRTITGRFQKTAMYANEQPGTREFDNTFSRTDALYSKADDVDPLTPLPQEAEQYRADLDRAMRSLKSGDVSVRLGRTPPVLRALGAPNLDMFINRDTVRKATNGVKHNVPLSVIENLPELMHDPLAVYRSSTQNDAVVILLEAQDANGNPVVSAVHMNARKQNMEINRIASVYGTVGGMSKVQGMEDAGLVLYRRAKKNPNQPHSAGLQLSGESTNQGSDSASRRYSQGLQLPKEGDPAESSRNILSSADIRKNKTLYSRSGNPAMDAETSRKMGFNVEKGWFDKAKDFYQMAADKDRTELKQWWQETFRKLNTKTFDGLAPLKYAEDAAGKSDAMVSGYTAARMSAGSGSVTAAVLEHGLVRYNKKEGITERIPGTGKADSLMGILDGLGNHRENFLKWIAGHRSERLMSEGKENNFTADEIAYMKSLNRGNEQLFADQKVKYDAFIKSIIDLQQDMGLIDPDSRATWEDAWYLPYYREAENGETHGPWTTRGIANQSSTIRKLKGSDLTIKDPIENLFNYVAKSVDASMKNEAMRRSVTNLADTGVIDIIDSPNEMDYQRLKKDTVKVFVDGKEQLARVNDPDLYRAFTMIDLERSNSLFMRAARQAKRVLTIGTTSMPDFIIRNFMRDAIHSWAINKDGFKPAISSWQGLKKAMRTDDTLVDMMFAGATFGGGYSNVYDPAGTASSIRKVLRRKGYNDSQIREFESSIVRNSKEVMDKIGAGLEKYQKVSEGAENANRIATYDAALKAGKSKAQAAFESRDLMDFSMQGSSGLVIALSDMVPFFNARLQGMSKLGRAIKEDPREVLKRGGYIAGLSLALLALNWDDDRYEELPDWDKDAYWHAWIGDQHVRFPKPFEIGLMFGTLPERFVRTLGGADTPGKFGKVVAHNFFETMAFNPIPQVTRPILEAFVNYDFFKGGPIENMADSNVIAGARYNDQTTLLMREIGGAMNLSPKMMDHIITGYTGTLGSYILGATNIIMRNMGDNGASPSLRLDEMPVIKAFARGAEPAKSTQFTEDFYRMMTEANQINSTINSYRKQGRQDEANELLQDNREKLSQRKAFTSTQKQVKQLNDQIELTRIDRILTADQKRERIDRLMEKRNKLVQQTVKRIHPYFD
ncbi:LPD38 domain-containing protein [Pectobacterium betavasculorum]|uniref:LPD38 domain-containing protein n=1 Tax=Pectobacterium betavasculorum TaxID=55207 RepID=UPI00068A4E98|nr:LPD38 domain-containing protein [Pectobacterium betavasculorum]